MPRYIDADLLIKNIASIEYLRTLSTKTIGEAIDKTPTADVVEVVRCKDCKHYKPYAKPVEDFDGECVVRECETDENEFCSYGTPKERGGEK